MENKDIALQMGIDKYVSEKLERAKSLKRDFGTLFGMMFCEGANIFWETNDGFQIQKTTYAECEKRIRLRAKTLSVLLQERGVAPDAVVGLHMENSLDWIEIFWSILLSGRRPLLLNLRMTDGMLANVLEMMDAALVISEGKEFAVQTLYAENVTEADKPISETECGREIFLTSSGTSENIKVCSYTAEEIFAQISNAADIIRENKKIKTHYEGSIKQLTLLPFYHVFGLFAVYFWFAFFSRTFVHLPDMNPQTVLNTVRKHNVTHIFAVPLFWDIVYRSAMATIHRRGEKTFDKFMRGMRIAEKLEDVPVLGNAFGKLAFREVRENLFGDSIQFCISGGSAIRPEVLRFFNAIGYHIANGYGMTEIGITSVELSEKKSILNTASIGCPMRSVQYSLNKNGVLRVTGDSVAHAIVEGGVRTRPELRSVVTNDVMEMKNGRYYILGRMDDVIISENGENINPDITEQIFKLPDTNGHCLISVRENGKAIPALIVSVKKYTMPERIRALSETIRRQIEENGLSGYISRVVFVTDPLMTPAEIKVNRKRLARNYAEGRLHPIDEGERRDDEIKSLIEERVAQLVAETLDKEMGQIGTDCDFFLDLGGSSMDYYAFAGKLQEEFGIDITGESAKSLSSVRAISAFLEERLHA